MTVSNWMEQYRQENPRWFEPAAVYRLWDAEGNLLYIGSAFDPEERCKEHRKKPWWSQVASRTDEWHHTRGPCRGSPSKRSSSSVKREGAARTRAHDSHERSKSRRSPSDHHRRRP